MTVDVQKTISVFKNGLYSVCTEGNAVTCLLEMQTKELSLTGISVFRLNFNKHVIRK